MNTAWLDTLRELIEEAKSPLSFSAFFSVNLNPHQKISDISALLSLLSKYVNSTAMVDHSITVICKITERSASSCVR